MSVPIPQPPSIPFIGNVTALDKDVPLRSWVLLAKTYGEIYQLNILGTTIVSVNSYALANEVSDEKRFQKHVAGGLYQVRNLAFNDEPGWAVAHRLLMPAFGPMAVKGMLEEMRDICDQLVLKWERFGPNAVLDPADDFTRLTFDTIAYCSMSYRINSFYSDKQVPFIVAMGDFLVECGLRASRPRVLGAVLGKNAKYQQDMKVLKDLADQSAFEFPSSRAVLWTDPGYYQSLRREKANPIDKKDLLNTMLHSTDAQTGTKMDAGLISRNLVTFLIAGHETSSGMLTFAVYHLLRTPSALRKVREEIDRVIGDRPANAEDLSNLPYLTAVMRETLRLTPTTARRSVTPLKDTTLGGGKYFVRAGTTIAVNVWNMHRDPLVWGEDASGILDFFEAEEFRPERHLDGKFESLPPNAWQPFGFGLRGCIGRAFAWQEVTLVLASVFQKFDLTMVDPGYSLAIKQTLTVKPKGFYIHARRRTDKPTFYATPSSNLKVGATTTHESPTVPATTAALKPLYVFYGSNTGTSEAFAQRIANEAPSYGTSLDSHSSVSFIHITYLHSGFRSAIGTLDSALAKVPTDGPVIIITASFEGQPADNAAQFVDWLRQLEGTQLAGVRFAVFGCGNSDWTATFQAIPKLCDELFEKNGAKRLLERGSGDASKGDFFQVFDEFASKLWSTLSKEYATTRSATPASTLEVKTVDAGKERASILRQPDSELGRVVENKVLTLRGPVKRHIEFELPEGMTAQAGDYIAILPQNPARDVHRVLAHFGLSNEEEVVLTSVGPTSLPVGKPVKLSEVLAGYVELSQPATTRDLGILAEAATQDSTRAYIEELKASYSEAVQAKRLSILRILELRDDIDLPLGSFLQMLPAMRVRQYSISSSPLWNPSHITITISVLESPSKNEDGENFLGVASNYLATLRPGDRVQMAVRPSVAAFHPPSDPQTPVVMFCAGSGLAPMRGFIQERAIQKASGRDVGKMLLFFGCRSPDQDFLYHNTDLAEWIQLGVVDVRPTFSRSVEDSGGCKYVQDRILKDRADIFDAYRQNAAFFTCGSANVAKGIKASLVEIIKQADSTNTEDATVKFERILKGRYATDIFD
ncbi:Fatty acid hydroxylase [Mycena sanguinolenta]|uniref:Fatty acid hydroxylase n=1 Tax=Mycena sanguinolenta TaxID=230812 RepID=A0A8H6YZY7_9AGAR|nr:Fatty acid hydroxylase [Mycena sanguinolenta]